MLKKVFIASLLSLVLFVSGNFSAKAQTSTLPSPGLTPESKLYFLDKFGEALRELLTFTSEGKAKLQIVFAAERISEIKDMLESKGVEAKGIEVAYARLRANLDKVNTIIADKKTDGQDVGALAKELNDDFEKPKTALKETFEAEKQVLENKIEELKTKIRDAQQAGNTVLVESLRKELDAVKAQKDQLEIKKEEQEDTLDSREEKLEEEMDDKEEAEEAIREAEKEKSEVVDEAAKEGVTIPAETFKKFDQLISQAKELLSRQNYQGSKQLAKQAKESLENIKDTAEELDEAREDAEDLAEKIEEQEKEDNEDQAELLKQEQEHAEEEAKQAEERLREGGEESND